MASGGDQHEVNIFFSLQYVESDLCTHVILLKKIPVYQTIFKPVYVFVRVCDCVNVYALSGQSSSPRVPMTCLGQRKTILFCSKLGNPACLLC